MEAVDRELSTQYACLPCGTQVTVLRSAVLGKASLPSVFCSYCFQACSCPRPCQLLTCFVLPADSQRVSEVLPYPQV